MHLEYIHKHIRHVCSLWGLFVYLILHITWTYIPAFGILSPRCLGSCRKRVKYYFIYLLFLISILVFFSSSGLLCVVGKEGRENSKQLKFIIWNFFLKTKLRCMYKIYTMIIRRDSQCKTWSSSSSSSSWFFLSFFLSFIDFSHFFFAFCFLFCVNGGDFFFLSYKLEILKMIGNTFLT